MPTRPRVSANVRRHRRTPGEDIIRVAEQILLESVELLLDAVVANLELDELMAFSKINLEFTTL